MPSARSRLAEPVENESISRSMPSAVIVRIAPLPNCFSIVETACAIAFCRLSALPLVPRRRSARLIAAFLLLCSLHVFHSFISSMFSPSFGSVSIQG